MQIKNNYNIAWRMYNAMGKRCDEGVGIFNGDAGMIREIDDTNETMQVVFDDGKVVDYDYSQLEELELAYAITIHKSQGSEYPVVIIPVHSGPPMLMTRNLLYTAVTRGAGRHTGNHFCHGQQRQGSGTVYRSCPADTESL